MNTRLCSVVAVVAMMTLGSGCCRGTRNFLFGRGARCGLCNKAPNMAPQFGNTMQAPCPPATYAPTCPPAPPCTPQCNAVAPPAPTCQCGSNVYSGHAMGTCGESYAMQHGGCGCGDMNGGYVPMVADPYMQGAVVGTPYDGQVISDQVVGQTPMMGGQTIPNAAPIQSDDFTARKFDTDGNRILWEQPLPKGSAAL